MKFLRRALFILLTIALAVAVFQNQTYLGMPLEFAFLHWRFTLVLGIWILIAFLAGVVLFALSDAWRRALLHLEIRRKDAEIARMKQAQGEAPRDADGA